MFGNTPAFSSFSVDDLQKAKRFYAEKLGLKVAETPEGLELHLAGGARVFIYESDDYHAPEHTVLNFMVEDIDLAIAQLISALAALVVRRPAVSATAGVDGVEWAQQRDRQQQPVREVQRRPVPHDKCAVLLGEQDLCVLEAEAAGGRVVVGHLRREVVLRPGVGAAGQHLDVRRGRAWGVPGTDTSTLALGPSAGIFMKSAGNWLPGTYAHGSLVESDANQRPEIST